MNTTEYSARELLEIRGSVYYTLISLAIGVISISFQLSAQVPLRNTIMTIALSMCIITMGLLIRRGLRKRTRVIHYKWIAATVSITGTMGTKFTYAQNMDWTFAAQSYHLVGITIALLILLQFLYDRNIYRVFSVAVFVSWIVFLLMASHNGVVFHPRVVGPDGGFLHTDMQLHREVYFFMMMLAVAFISYQNIPNLELMVRIRTAELQKARDMLWGEMQLAKKIQTTLLPERPELSGYEITAYMEPAAEVGGDYYDVISVGGNDWIVIGDVSGHGVPAGLIMMMVQTSIHVALDQNRDLDPSGLLTVINRTITENVRKLNDDKYMTITVLAAHKDGRFVFAGLHQDILVYRASSAAVEVIETDGVWIGLMEDISGMIGNKSFTLDSGDVLLVYTDGITEAWSRGSRPGTRTPERDMFGAHRLSETLAALGARPTEEIRDGILQSLRQFECMDDVTMVVIRRV
ncbi:MAG TPA: SpoIIE family protein phosphatase [Spirochaetota bacterium]|nr:SpoIIE family protein phosphatase [Spirochaetota bacterium]HNT11106.1 SpoIIE family protein phosphatase [Spirochaetota bacterium]HOS40978.1 SpoIIE family protein phosphatase [Spirochaetota bacterium]